MTTMLNPATTENDIDDVLASLEAGLGFGDDIFTEDELSEELSAISDEDAELASLLAETTIEAAVTPTIAEPTLELLPTPEALEATVIAEIEQTEAIHALYDAAADEKAADEEIAESDTPKTAPDAAADAAKPPKAPRVSVSRVGKTKSEVLTSTLGNVSEGLLLEAADLTLSEEALREKQSALLDIIDVRPGSAKAKTAGSSTQKKVAEKVIQLFGYVKNGGTLNEVMRRTFKVLARDGEITSGEKGNLHAELLSKPYSVLTCKAQAGQMMAMLPMLKIALATSKGRLVANPDSLILAKVKAELGL